MQKKDDKVGNQTANKEGEKKESENFWLLRMSEKQKSCLITSG